MPDPVEVSLMKKRASQAVSRFLKSVVVIDNEAEMGKEKTKGDHVIDIDTLSVAFSLKGLSCSVYSPKAETEEETKISSLLIRQNDVAVVDWQLGQGTDKTKLCKDALKDALTLDKKEGNPPRLIVIYTVENLDDEMAKSLLRELSGLDLRLIDDEGDEVGIKGKNVRIIFRGKKKANEDGFLPKHVVPAELLPNIIPDEYVKLVDGILPIVTLNAVAALRGNMNRLLGTFRKDLDPAYVLHTILVPHIEDSREYLIKLIIEECGVILESDPGLQSCADSDLLCEWIKNSDPLPFKHPTNHAEISKDILIDRLKGTSTIEQVEQSVSKKAHRMYGKENPERDNLLEFMRLSSLKRELSSKQRTNKKDWVPELTQGTVIKDPSKNFWLCLIPRCDSVRLNGDVANFPFIPLTKLPDTDAHAAHLCLLDNADCICFQLLDNINWRKIKMIPFHSSNGNSVRAENDKGRYIFKEASAYNTKYEWIADLKDAFITKIVADLAPGLSRIGIEEFEWQRRNRDS